MEGNQSNQNSKTTIGSSPSAAEVQISCFARMTAHIISGDSIDKETTKAIRGYMDSIDALFDKMVIKSA